MTLESRNEEPRTLEGSEPGTGKRYRSSLHEVLAMAFPVIIATSSGTLMGFVDFWMVSHTGISAAAAVSPSSILVFTLISLFIGILSCTNTFVSQSFAKNDFGDCSRYAWQGLWISVLAGLAAVMLWPAAPYLFALLGHDAKLQPLETIYFQIRLFSVASIVGCTALTGFFQGISRPWLTMVAAIVANLLNVFFNWVFIYGNLGAPAMGIAGSALGTVLAAAVQVALLLGLFLSKRYALKFRSRALWRIDGHRMSRLLHLGIPAGLNMLLDVGTWGIFVAYFIGRLGEVPLAASNMATQMLHISFMPTVGLGIAITALVGQNVGRGDIATARARARTGFLLGMGYMFLMGVMFFVFRHPLIGLFLKPGEDPARAAQVIELGSTILIFAAVFQIFDAMGIIGASALKGAGDTRFPALTTIVLGLVVFLPVCWFLTRAIDWGALGAWTGATVYIFALGTVLLLRWRSRAWESIDIFRKKAAQPALLVERPMPYEPGEEMEGS